MESRTFLPRRYFRSTLLSRFALYIGGCVIAAAGWRCIYRLDASRMFAKRWYKKRLFAFAEIVLRGGEEHLLSPADTSGLVNSVEGALHSR